MSKRVRLTYAAGEFIMRQSPGSTGHWGDTQFVADNDHQSLDGWFVYDSVPFPQTALCNPDRIVFITGEPEAVRSYNADFLAQFAAVVSPQTGLGHPRVFNQQPAIPWWVGVTVSSQPGKTTSGYSLDYDRLKSMTTFEKPKLASVICSNKMLTDGHRQRLRVVERLRSEFPGQIDFFGHGSLPVADKWDAIEPYRFHIVFENIRANDYWTEKLADTFLAGAVPIYCGCPNVCDYFSPDSLISIDRNNPDQVVDTVRSVLESDDFSSRRGAVNEARGTRVLEQYNLFPSWLKVIDHLSSSAKPGRVTIYPESDFVDPIRTRVKRKVKRLVFGLGSRSG